MFELIGRNGIKVIFTNGKAEQDFALIFITGVDTPESTLDVLAKIEADGFRPVRHEAVVYTTEGWKPRTFEPSLRQRLGMRPVFKVA